MLKVQKCILPHAQLFTIRPFFFFFTYTDLLSIVFKYVFNIIIIIIICSIINTKKVKAGILAE